MNIEFDNVESNNVIQILLEQNSTLIKKTKISLSQDFKEFENCSVRVVRVKFFDSIFSFGLIILKSDIFPIKLGQKFDREFTVNGASSIFKSTLTNNRPLGELLFDNENDMPEWVPRIIGLRLFVQKLSECVEIIKCTPKTVAGECVLHFFSVSKIETKRPDEGVPSGFVILKEN